jgi:hypothetical protein
MQLALPRSASQRIRTLRTQAALFERVRGLDRCLRRLTPSDDGPVPFPVAAELYAHWGDPLTPAGEAHLRSCLAHATQTEGAIVQCGASVLSLVLGSVCGAAPKSARQVWCLEHDTHWGNVMRSWITQYRVPAVHVIVSRPRLFDGHVWYSVDVKRLPEQIGLLVCDGDRATPTGVIGALERLGERLTPDATVLARRVSRAEDLRALAAWAKSHDASCVVLDREDGFVKISRRPSS